MNLTQSYKPGSLAIEGHFTLVDYIILVVVLLASLAIGIVTGMRKTRDTRDFLTGGRDMNPIAVCLSLLGGVVSSISVQGNSTEVYLHGTQLWMNLIGCFWGIFIVMFLVLPVLYPLNLVSICQYLEMRFNSPLLKKLGSFVQIINSIMYLGICLYAPSLILSSAIGIPTSLSLLIFGSICAVYVTLGGTRAVVYTDVIQTLMMFIGLILVVIYGIIDLGGISKAWDIAEKGKRIEFFNMSPSPLVRHTFWSVQVLGLYFVTSIVGLSQPQFQRLASVSSLRISQSLCIAFFVGLSLLWSLFYFSGLIAYATYADCDPLSAGKIEKADQILAYMVGDKLSHLTGLVGVFVSAVAGALLSSLSSQANALVVLLWEDFLSGWWFFAKVSVDTATRITKVLSTCSVILGICSAFLVAELGTIFQVGYSISGAFIGPFSGLFITGITAPWVNTKGVIIGFLTSLSFNLWLVMGKFYNGGGSSEGLPFPNGDCPTEDILIRSIHNNTSLAYDIIPVATTSAHPIQDDAMIVERDYLLMYDISYCYIGSIGIILVWIVSSIISFITGPVKPSEINVNLVNQFCFQTYCRIIGYKSGSKEFSDIQLTAPANTVIENRTSGTVENGHYISKENSKVGKNMSHAFSNEIQNTTNSLER